VCQEGDVRKPFRGAGRAAAALAGGRSAEEEEEKAKWFSKKIRHIQVFYIYKTTHDVIGVLFTHQKKAYDRLLRIHNC
jgi:hypothetical protein